MRGPLWTEGVPPSKRAEGAHAAEPAKTTTTCVPDNINEVPAAIRHGRKVKARR